MKKRAAIDSGALFLLPLFSKTKIIFYLGQAPCFYE